MKRYILFAFAFALGWLCLESDGALTAYTDSDKVKDIPLAGRCAHDGYDLDYDVNQKIHEYIRTKLDVAFCQKLCEQWALCKLWIYKVLDVSKISCTLVPMKAFTAQELTKLRISGPNECPRSDGCIFNDKFYYGTRSKTTVKNVPDPIQCRTRCEDTIDCSHLTWSMAQGTENDCYLFYKGNFGSIATGTKIVANKEPRKFVSGGSTCDTCFDFHREPNLKRIQFPDGSVYVTTATYYECQEICNSNPLCTLFEWRTIGNRCYMFNPFTNLKQANDVVTGLRDCDLACGQCNGLGLKDPNDQNCDRAGNCKCKANYIDPLCTICATGYDKASDGSCILKSG